MKAGQKVRSCLLFSLHVYEGHTESRMQSFLIVFLAHTRINVDITCDDVHG